MGGSDTNCTGIPVCQYSQYTRKGLYLIGGAISIGISILVLMLQTAQESAKAATESAKAAMESLSDNRAQMSQHKDLIGKQVEAYRDKASAELLAYKERTDSKVTQHAVLIARVDQRLESIEKSAQNMTEMIRDYLRDQQRYRAAVEN